ncbi:MAG: hypothetical protein H6Q69_2863 [Firmicutes bacterium]|nr:hypothetical protein [Bacillota bacterium]
MNGERLNFEDNPKSKGELACPKCNEIEIEYYVSNQVSDKDTLIISIGIWEPIIRRWQ